MSTRRTDILVVTFAGLLMLLIVFGIGYPFLVDYMDAARLRHVRISASTNPGTCPHTHPVAIDIINATDRSIRGMAFSLKGYHSGDRHPVIQSMYLGYAYDHAIAPGGEVKSCWQVPRRNFESQMLESAKPESLPSNLTKTNRFAGVTWRARDKVVNFDGQRD